MASRKPQEKCNASLPYAALQLLAPPVRLVSAALWKVMKQRDVMQYGVLEEFVTSACETVPGLLTLRHQGKLALGLRARLILELCSTQSDSKVIEQHLKRIRAPAAPSHPSAPTVRQDVKILKTVEHFHALVDTLLTDPVEKEQFFKEEFPAEYGPRYDQELEKLLWEFLIRLDQLLPVPNLAQTVSWLSDAPAVLEECAQAATQPQLLEILLQHQTCLGHLESAASLPPNMGDSILTSLSLPPSGRVPSSQSTGSRKSHVNQSDGTQTRNKTSFVTPVIGIISNEDVPLMISSKRTQKGGEPASSKEVTTGVFYPKENLKFTSVKHRQKSKDDGGKGGDEEEEEENTTSKISNRVKRKQPDRRESASDEEEEVLGISGRKRPGRLLNESDEDEAETGRDEGRNRVATSMTPLGGRELHLPSDPSLCSIFLSCLNSQPKVIINKLSVPSASVSGTGGEGKSSRVQQQHQHQKRKSPVKAPTRKRKLHQKLDSDFSGMDDIE
ncbi:hypothetical protein PAMP_015804 [Pampus punctatissimus]